MLAAMAAPASGQVRSLCLLPGPSTECRSYLVFEAAGWSPVVHDPRLIVSEGTHTGTGQPVYVSLPTRELSHAFGWSIGWAVHVAPAWAVGVDVGYAFGEASRRRSVDFRVRRRVHPRIALDLVPGLFSLRETGARPDPDRLGYKVGLRASLWDVGFLGVRYDGLPLDREVTEVDGIRRTDPGGLESSWSATAGLEGAAGLIGSAVGLAAVLVALGIGLGGVG
jgi:hypothetical protein